MWTLNTDYFIINDNNFELFFVKILQTRNKNKVTHTRYVLVNSRCGYLFALGRSIGTRLSWFESFFQLFDLAYDLIRNNFNGIN